MAVRTDILAFGAHPDDVEMGAGGYLLKARDEGRAIVIVDLTRGELGTRGNATIRHQEATIAAQMLRLKDRVQLDLGDGFFEINDATLRAVIITIRKFRPHIILANAVTDRHPDHGRGAALIERAVFLSGLSRIQTYDDDVNQEPWRPQVLYHYHQDRQLKADVVVDISTYMDAKMDLIKCYKSQFYNPDSAERDTPLTGADFFELMRAKAKVYGRPCGFLYGEAFTGVRTIGVNDLLDLK